MANSTRTAYVIAKVRITPRDGKIYPDSEVAGYIQAALDNAMSKCDPGDGVEDLIAFVPQRAPLETSLLQKMLDTEGLEELMITFADKLRLKDTTNG